MLSTFPADSKAYSVTPVEHTEDRSRTLWGWNATKAVMKALVAAVVTMVAIMMSLTFLLPGPQDCGYCTFDPAIIGIGAALHEDTLTPEEFRNRYALPGRVVRINMSSPLHWEWEDFRHFHPARSGNIVQKLTERGDCSAVGETSAIFTATEVPGRRLNDSDGCEWYHMLSVNQLDAPLEAKLVSQVGRTPAFMDAPEFEILHFQFFFAHVVSSLPISSLAAHTDAIGATGTFHAQVKGRKRWWFRPVERCLSECGDAWRTFVAEPGEYLSFNADFWMHRAEMLGSEDGLSLSVSREFNAVGDPRHQPSAYAFQVGVAIAASALLVWWPLCRSCRRRSTSSPRKQV